MEGDKQEALIRLSGVYDPLDKYVRVSGTGKEVPYMEGVCALITVQCYQMNQHFNTLFNVTQAYVFSHVAPLNNIILPKLQMF